MNVYALFPLIATIAYIPLLISTCSSRPWHKRQPLFIAFLLSAMLWSLFDYVFRSNFFPQHMLTVWKITLLSYPFMAVQFHAFISSFYAPGQRRWLPFAYVSLAIMLVLTVLGYIGEGVRVEGDKLYPDYGIGVVVIAAPLLTLALRSYVILLKRLKTLDDPVQRNQIISLLIGLSVLCVFTIAALLPWGKEIPISHYGNLINAFILSYAAVRHQLVDIGVVLRRSLAWATLGIIGAIFYWTLLGILQVALGFQIDLKATIVSTLIAIGAVLIVLRLRLFLIVGISRAFQGQGYDDRQKLSDFADKIQNVFSLQKQGGVLLELVTKAIRCKWACLLFPDAGSDDFSAQIIEPAEGNPLSGLKLDKDNPILGYLKEEKKPLNREDLSILTRFRSLWGTERQEIEHNQIELFLPLISRDKLIAVMVLGKRLSSKYSLEDVALLKDVAAMVAVSMEKEYLQEQLREREEELSVINRSSAIIASSLSIHEIYDAFISELKKVVEVNWAAISLVEENDLYFLAISSDVGSAWQLKERIPLKGTATEWSAAHKATIYEPDLSVERMFDTGKFHFEHGIRSIVYLPLVVNSAVIGSLAVGSRTPNAYSQRQLRILEQLASQIAMPVENARLYARVEERARIDELTGLLNRRSLDETIAGEVGRHSRYGGTFTLIILDLDNFKAFNDNYGHLAGDKLLRQIGTIIKGAIRTADQAFRYGGDEFAIVCPQTAMDAANKVSERVRKQVALKAKAGYIPITVSLGLASWPADGLTPNEVIAAADAALYKAKRGGGNQTICASGTLLPVDDIMFELDSNQSNESLSIIYSLASTVDAREKNSRNHSKKVSECALALGKALNLPSLEMSRLEACALLHDIGKIGISDDILNKSDGLTVEEWEAIKVHPQLGATIVSRSRQLAPCISGILYHHEKYDGSGYPKGLKGEAIPLEARILAVADAFAAMTSDRPYSDALTSEKALENLRQGAGMQFDPRLVEVFATLKNEALLEKEKKRRSDIIRAKGC